MFWKNLFCFRTVACRQVCLVHIWTNAACHLSCKKVGRPYKNPSTSYQITLSVNSQSFLFYHKAVWLPSKDRLISDHTKQRIKGSWIFFLFPAAVGFIAIIAIEHTSKISNQSAQYARSGRQTGHRWWTHPPYTPQEHRRFWLMWSVDRPDCG